MHVLSSTRSFGYKKRPYLKRTSEGHADETCLRSPALFIHPLWNPPAGRRGILPLADLRVMRRKMHIEETPAASSVAVAGLAVA